MPAQCWASKRAEKAVDTMSGQCQKVGRDPPLTQQWINVIVVSVCLIDIWGGGGVIKKKIATKVKGRKKRLLKK